MKDIISEFISRLKEAEHQTTEVLASGSNIHNFDSYQRVLGNRDGLKQAYSILETLLTEDSETY
jgi:aromatic ring-opening dioxygenase catalytic subunit (LigB family)